MSMSERVAVITGGAGDLAHAIAAELRAQQMTVHAPGRDLLDVCAPESVTHFFSTLERVDLLINNAAIREDALSAQMTVEQWDRVIATDLCGAFLCSQAVTRKVAAQRSGHVINIGSFSAQIGNAGQANYAAAKAGLIGLTQSLAREFGKRNVRVNCVLPGFLETKFSAGMAPQFREAALEMHELRRFNTVEEAGRFITFLDTMQFVS